jgi:hypothetical protein
MALLINPELRQKGPLVPARGMRRGRKIREEFSITSSSLLEKGYIKNGAKGNGGSRSRGGRRERLVIFIWEPVAWRAEVAAVAAARVGQVLMGQQRAGGPRRRPQRPPAGVVTLNF